MITEQRLWADAVSGSRFMVSVDPHSGVVDSEKMHISLAALGVSHRQSPGSKAQAMLVRYGDLFSFAGRRSS